MFKLKGEIKMKKSKKAARKPFEQQISKLRRDVENMPTHGDPWLEKMKEETLQDCDETERIHAETQKIVANARKVLAKYKLE